jgi:2-keto-4-pentenoate hydratase
MRGRARDIPAGPCTREEAGDAVGEVFAAIEIVEKRYDDLAKLTTPTLIADQVFHAGGVLGPPVAGWRALGLDLAAMRGRLSVDGQVRGEGVGADLLGHPFEALAWLASSPCAAEFGGLRAGQVVFLGSVTPPIWLDGPCTAVVEFDTLGIVELRLT